MMRELEHKSKEFDTLRRIYDDQVHGNDSLKQVIHSMNLELDNSHALINELQQHSEALLEKNCYFEKVIIELEEKNKKMTDLINS